MCSLYCKCSNRPTEVLLLPFSKHGLSVLKDGGQTKSTADDLEEGRLSLEN